MQIQASIPVAEDVCEDGLFKTIARTTREDWDVPDLARSRFGAEVATALVLYGKLRASVKSCFGVAVFFGAQAPKRWHVAVAMGVVLATLWALSPNPSFQP